MAADDLVWECNMLTRCVIGGGCILILINQATNVVYMFLQSPVMLHTLLTPIFTETTSYTQDGNLASSLMVKSFRTMSTIPPTQIQTPVVSTNDIALSSPVYSTPFYSQQTLNRLYRGMLCLEARAMPNIENSLIFIRMFYKTA